LLIFHSASSLREQKFTEEEEEEEEAEAEESHLFFT
jgi:hypothetical protein